MPPDLIDRLKERARTSTSGLRWAIYFIRVNVTRTPFDDPRVRRAAASLVIDRERIVSRITKGGERVAYSVSPPGIANGTNVYEPPRGLRPNPELARQLLAEAGYPEGRGFPTVTYTYNTQESHRKIGVELREMWGRQLGPAR